MEIVEYIVYIFATIVMLLIGPIVMIVMPNRNNDEVKTYTEEEGYRKKVSVAIILQILSILVLLDLWKIVEIF